MADLLDGLGRAFGTRNANARSTAALLTNPGCERRTVLDAARVDLVAVAERLGSPTQFGQSPFAIGQGNRFEQRIKEDDYAALVVAINDLLHIFDGVDDFRSVNLERVPGLKGRALIKARAEQTADVLEAIANGDPDAPHVVDHGVTSLDVGDNTVYLEQDALAFRDGEDLRICEIKGFPIIDGTASPVKVGAAARQTAVYVASIQDTLAARGFDPGFVSSEVILVCPKNFSIGPVAVLVDVDREVRALRRQLRRRIAVTSLLDQIEDGATSLGEDLGDLVAAAGAVEVGTDADRATTRRLVGQLHYLYSPGCIAECDLARHCRSCSEAADDPARLGGDVATLLGGLDTVASALAIIDGAPATPDQAEVADLLRTADRAIGEAMGTAP